MAEESSAKMEGFCMFDDTLQQGYDESEQIVQQIEPWLEILTPQECEMIFGPKWEGSSSHQAPTGVAIQQEPRLSLPQERTSDFSHGGTRASRGRELTMNKSKDAIPNPRSATKKVGKTSKRQRSVDIKKEASQKSRVDVDVDTAPGHHPSNLSWVPRTHIQQKYNESNTPCSSPKREPANKHCPITRDPAYIWVKAAPFAPKQYDGLKDGFYYTK